MLVYVLESSVYLDMLVCVLQCGELFTQNDMIPLNGTEEEVDALHARMTEKRLQQKLEKV
jgi:hypothetical protein